MCSGCGQNHRHPVFEKEKTNAERYIKSFLTPLFRKLTKKKKCRTMSILSKNRNTMSIISKNRNTLLETKMKTFQDKGSVVRPLILSQITRPA
jgi:hypothetical protein